MHSSMSLFELCTVPDDLLCLGREAARVLVASFSNAAGQQDGHTRHGAYPKITLNRAIEFESA